MPRSPRWLMAIEYEKCRVWGHGWEDFVPNGKRPSDWGMRFSLRCVRCGTERHDLIDSLGQLGSRHYDYPDGYSMAKDETPDRSTLRLELLQQLRTTAREKSARRRKAG